jgi:hypothetical protein
MASEITASQDVVLSSSESLVWYRSSATAERGFCRVCGSNQFFRISKPGSGRTPHQDVKPAPIMESLRPHSVASLRRLSARPAASLNNVQHVASGGVPQSLGWPRFSTLAGACMVDKSMTGSFQINLPKDLLSEARRQPKPKNEQLKVEGWSSSWLSKVSEILVGKD